MSKFANLEQVMWTSHALATFSAMAAEVEVRLGPPALRDLDSNGIGLFDAHLLGFPCGLEVALWRLQRGPQLEPIDPVVELSCYDVYSPEARDLDHIAFHLGLPIEQLRPMTDVGRAARSFIVMRSDDNGNEVELTRVTSRCEAEAVAAQYERRGHKQLYWIAEVDPAVAG